MIKFEHTEVIGWEAAIRGMRNPMNSWAKSHSIFFTPDGKYHDISGNTGRSTIEYVTDMELDCTDVDLMMRLSKAGSVDGKFMRMIAIYVDITAPMYWWKEFDTYKVGTVANSCSTMHKIHEKEFTFDDFSTDHLIGCGPDTVDIPFEDCLEHSISTEKGTVTHAYNSSDALNLTIKVLNFYREKFLKTKNKKYWWQMIQLLPSSYNQKRTIMLNYEVLAGIYPKRRNHKLDEWHSFCDWIESIPYSELITCRCKEVHHPEGTQPIPKKTYISHHDRLVLSAYTGYMMVEWDDLHAFVEKTLGRPVFSHELAYGSDTNDELRKKLHDEFMNICKEVSDDAD